MGQAQSKLGASFRLLESRKDSCLRRSSERGASFLPLEFCQDMGLARGVEGKQAGCILQVAGVPERFVPAEVQRAGRIFLTAGVLSGYGSVQRWRGKASSMRAGAASCRFFCTAGPKNVRIRELRGTGESSGGEGEGLLR